MTKPSGGYPDFQGYASWKGTPTVTAPTVYPAGTTQLAQVNLANYNSLNITATSSAGTGKIIVNWWTDATMAVLVDAYNIPIALNTIINLSLPAITSFASVSVHVPGVGSMTMKWTVTPSNASPSEVAYPGAQAKTGVFSKIYAASAGDTLTAQYVVPGEAFVSFVPFDSAAKVSVTVQGLDETGAADATYFYNPGSAGPYQNRIMLPPVPVQLVITNTDGAAPHEVSCVLVQANG